MPSNANRFFADRLAAEIHILCSLPYSISNHAQTGQLIIRTVKRMIVDALKRHETVSIVGFGKFEVKWRKPRRTNLKVVVYREGAVGSGGKVEYEPNYTIPGRHYVKFTPAIGFAAMVNMDHPTKVERKRLESWGIVYDTPHVDMSYIKRNKK